MESATCYVLVSKTVYNRQNSCGAPGCGIGYQYCKMPYPPACHAVCVHDPLLLAQHPDCQEYQRQYDAWVTAHYHEEHTGGTRLGPMHYFSNCKSLSRGHRRKDAKVVSLPVDLAQLLALPLCKQCQAKMAPYEEQMAEPVGVLK